MCIAGARWVQEHILESNPEAKIKVYTVWFNVLARDRRSSWSEEHFGDDRVVEFWDGDRLFSPWYRDHLPGHSKTIAWDLYALYGPEARWEKVPSVAFGQLGPHGLLRAEATCCRSRRSAQRLLEFWPCITTISKDMAQKRVEAADRLQGGNSSVTILNCLKQVRPAAA